MEDADSGESSSVLWAKVDSCDESSVEEEEAISGCRCSRIVGDDGDVQWKLWPSPALGCAEMGLEKGVGVGVGVGVDAGVGFEKSGPAEMNEDDIGGARCR